MLLRLEAGGDIAALVRNANARSLVVSISPALDPLAMAQARAAIGPLAVELAPARRLNAVFPTETAAAAHIDAAVEFLDQARSTTGQLLDIA
ncbi:Rossmann fold domain-containing protein [Sphingomonas faeni]|uniref:Rossmann fold domain-containing protein n=1 Tax=Sphingomonas faeni TaxID=185950 RepID=UPI00335A2628